MIIDIVVACTNANGDADLFFFKMELENDQYDLGEHYEAAKNYADDQGYEGEMVVFDNSMPKALHDIFVWESASTINIEDFA